MSLTRYARCLVSLFMGILILVSPALARSKEKVLYSFEGGTGDASYPVGGLVFDGAGNLYGASNQGGGFCPPAQCGTVFQLAPPAQKGGKWTESVLYIFKGNIAGDGNTPVGSVIMDKAGNLYGTTGYGGNGSCVLLGTKVGCGTVYELSPPAQKGGAWTEIVLYNFQSGNDGYLPNGELVFDGAGNLYGATMFGGGHGTTCNDLFQYCGSVFELSPPKKKGGAWTEKVLHGFKGPPDGANPNGGLVLDSKGVIYGTTSRGGYDCPHSSNQGCGTVFKLTPPTLNGGKWTEAVLHRFYRKTSDGAGPAAGVVSDPKGNLYGTTEDGGANGWGTAFRLEFPKQGGSWKETVMCSFGDDGYQPLDGVLLDGSGNMYVTTSGGNNSGGGTVFRLKKSLKGSGWTSTVLHNFTGPTDGAFPVGTLFDKSGQLFGVTQIGGTGENCRTGNCGTVFEISP